MKKKKYQAIGLLELVISLGVAAIAVGVLMSMASNSMREAIRYERHDALTRLALDGALVVRRHAERANDFDDEMTFDGSLNSCYKLEIFEDDSRVNFDYARPYNEGEYSNLQEDEEFHTDIIYDETNDFRDIYYVAYCITGTESGDFGILYIGKVVTGYVECRNCGIEPYEHNIIVRVANFNSEG